MAEVIERIPGREPYSFIEIHAKDVRELRAIKDELELDQPDEEAAFEYLKEELGATEDPKAAFLRRKSGTE